MEDYELKSQILATIDDLNQYLNGNVTGLGLIDTLKDTINYVEDYAMTIRESKDFDLKKYLAESKLLKENKIAQAIKDEAEQPDSKVGAAIFKRYAKKIENASKEDYRKILTSMERELIDTHPDTFDGDDDIVASFMALED